MNNDAIKTAKELLGKDYENLATGGKSLSMIYSLLTGIEYTEHEMQSKMKSLSERLLRECDLLDAGNGGLNSCGVVQGLGLDIDLLAKKRQCDIEKLELALELTNLK